LAKPNTTQVLLFSQMTLCLIWTPNQATRTLDWSEVLWTFSLLC